MHTPWPSMLSVLVETYAYKDRQVSYETKVQVSAQRHRGSTTSEDLKRRMDRRWAFLTTRGVGK